MSLLTVHEYQQLAVGDDLDAPCPSVSNGQAAALLSLRTVYGFDVFKFTGKNKITAQQYVGVVQVGDLTVEVLPKIDRIDDDSKIRRNLVAMLAAVRDLRISEGDIARVATQRAGILEILIRIFCDKLFEQVHKGVLRRYESRSENLNVVRGKIGITEQIRLNSTNPERLFCHFDEFHDNIPLNQILKACLRLLARTSLDSSNQRKINELLLVLDTVTDVAQSALPWHQINFDRTTNRFEPIYKLAELFLRSTPPDISGGGAQGFSLFFEMNTLFEQYIGRMAKRTFQKEGINVRLQGPRRYLAMAEKSRREVFALKPDIVAIKDTAPAWIIDTKWKVLSLEDAKEGVAQGDMYQMYAYAQRYNCPDVMLLYPHHTNLGTEPGLRTSYILCNSQAPAAGKTFSTIKIGTIDLADLSTIQWQLRRLVDAS